jgi:hypothetical protein
MLRQLSVANYRRPAPRESPHGTCEQGSLCKAMDEYSDLFVATRSAVNAMKNRNKRTIYLWMLRNGGLVDGNRPVAMTNERTSSVRKAISLLTHCERSMIFAILENAVMLPAWRQRF